MSADDDGKPGRGGPARGRAAPRLSLVPGGARTEVMPAIEGVPGPRGQGILFVTGAGGFIGRYVANAFVSAGWDVAGFGFRLERAESAQPLGLPDDRRFEGLVSRRLLSEAAARVGPPEAIVHAAGGSSVGGSLADPGSDFDRTVGSVREVLGFMRAEAPGSRLVFLSSAAVYGSTVGGRISEAERRLPISPYGLHKTLAEELIAGWANLFGLDTCILRLFSIYGPGIRKQLLWELSNQLRLHPAAIDLFGRGTELRDFLYVEDAVRLIGCLVDCSRATGALRKPLTVNGGTGQATSVEDIVGWLRDALGAKETRITFNGIVREGDPSHLVADATVARSLGFAPLVSPEEGVRRFAHWVGAASER